MKDTTDLLARLRRHAGPAVMGCACRSDLPNCPACDCGHAADEIERLRAALQWIVDNTDHQKAPILVGHVKLALKDRTCPSK